MNPPKAPEQTGPSAKQRPPKPSAPRKVPASPGPPGRWGLALLVATGVAGVVLAAHGWSARSAGLAPGALAPGTSSAPRAGATAGARSGSGAAPAAASPAQTSHPSGSPSPSASSGQGPLLSSQSYASAAYQIWPGPRSAGARAALTGLRVTVHPGKAGLAVAAGLTGQALPPAHVYAAGARVYIIEYTLGDDSNNTDYSLGDDGLVVTDAAGRILR